MLINTMKSALSIVETEYQQPYRVRRQTFPPIIQQRIQRADWLVKQVGKILFTWERFWRSH